MIIDNIRKVVQESPEKKAIIFNDHFISYQQLEEVSNKLANALKNLGVNQGDRVALIIPNLPQFIFSYYAILKTGAIVVPINYMLEDDEIFCSLKKIKPAIIIYWEGFRKYVTNYLTKASPKPTTIVLGKMKAYDSHNLLKLISQYSDEPFAHDVQPDDTAVIQFTSGISKPPIGIELSYENIIASVEGHVQFFHYNKSDVFGAVLPLFFVTSQTAILNSALYQGATIVLHSKLDYQEIMRSIDEYQITVFAASPNVYQAMTSFEADSFSGASLKYCLSSWIPITDELEAKFEEKFKVPILNCYSITETCGIITANHPSFERKAGSVGLALPDFDVQVLNDRGNQVPPNEIGEIVVQGKNVLKGYWNEETATGQLKNGWFYTGDLGKKDEQGYIFLVDKKADIIVKSGFPIYTDEIEELLLAHPKVKEAAVIAIPHPDLKQDVQACLVLKENEQLTEEEIVDYCKERIPVYKCPQKIKFYQELPRTKMGRISKRKLLKDLKINY